MRQMWCLSAPTATTTAAQESLAVGPVSPVAGGKVIKSKTMTAVGAVTTVTADSLAINDGANSLHS